MNIVETTVMYVEKDDLAEHAKTLNLEQIEWHQVTDRDNFLKSDVVILEMKGRYKVLKSRH